MPKSRPFVSAGRTPSDWRRALGFLANPLARKPAGLMAIGGEPQLLSGTKEKKKRRGGTRGSQRPPPHPLRGVEAPNCLRSPEGTEPHVGAGRPPVPGLPLPQNPPPTHTPRRRKSPKSPPHTKRGGGEKKKSSLH